MNLSPSKPGNCLVKMEERYACPRCFQISESIELEIKEQGVLKKRFSYKISCPRCGTHYNTFKGGLPIVTKETETFFCEKCKKEYIKNDYMRDRFCYYCGK